MSSQGKPPVVITHDGELRFTARVRGHRITFDQPEHVGGENTAPTPLEVLAASLGACVALYVKRFCRARELSVEGLRVEVGQQAATNLPSRIGRFTVRIHPPVDFPERY